MDKRLAVAYKERGLGYAAMLIPFMILAEIRYKLGDIRRANGGSLYRAVLNFWRPDLMLLGLWIALKGICLGTRDLLVFLCLIPVALALGIWDERKRILGLLKIGAFAFMIGVSLGLAKIARALFYQQETTVTITGPDIPVVVSPPVPAIPVGGAVMTWPISDPSFLSWSASGATSCTAHADPATAEWEGTKPVSGGQNVNPSQTTTYTLVCQ